MTGNAHMVLFCLGLLAIVAPSWARSAEQPLKVCLVSGSAEYHSDETLAAFKTWIEANRSAPAF